MSLLVYAVEAGPDSTSVGDDLVHAFCCDPDLGLCGEDLSGTSWAADDDIDCVVCADLEEAGWPCDPDCPRVS
ncbi:hypothetical protein B4N89_27520 [Embleya scabrispora]|uniref:Uncharacterized protein n=1 Tax=Embleya scabrispora TaxID=159449 RepID=A0A1T3P4Z7_9ACTN|nr:hypothetical protein [Embleya scabrispora]OPC84177.1 hypothetical protein B4N89_27520 [Embleya scabrispora]